MKTLLTKHTIVLCIFRDSIVKFQSASLQQREYGYAAVNGTTTTGSGVLNLVEGGPGNGSGGGSQVLRGFGIGPILSILNLSRSPSVTSRSNSVCNNSQDAVSSIIYVLPMDCEEENSLQRIRYKLETLYPAQKDYVITQLLDNVSSCCVVLCCILLFMNSLIYLLDILFLTY
jgi:hypothetical protein